MLVVKIITHKRGSHKGTGAFITDRISLSQYTVNVMVAVYAPLGHAAYQ